MLVVPVVAAVVVGGLGAGVTSAVAGFLVYDFVFIPPYYTLTVGAAENWVAFGVYAVVVLLVAQVVAHLETARHEAQQRAVETQRLYELSELLVKDRSIEDLLETIVTAVRTVFDVPGVALLLPCRRSIGDRGLGRRGHIARTAPPARSRIRDSDQRGDHPA